jgi:hypothetical protein
MEIDKDEQEALEGMFFAEADIALYLKGDLSAKQLSDHLADSPCGNARRKRNSAERIGTS